MSKYMIWYRTKTGKVRTAKINARTKTGAIKTAKRKYKFDKPMRVLKLKDQVKRSKPKKKTTKKKTVKRKAVKKSNPVKRKVVKRKKTVNKNPIKKSLKKGVKRVAKKKKTTKKRRNPGGRGQKAMMDMVQTGVLTALGAVGAGFVAGAIPIKDEQTGKFIRPLIPVAAAVALGMTRMGKQKMLKPVINGMVAASALSLLKNFVPNLPLLAQDDELLYVPDELLGEFEPELGQGFTPELGYVSDFEDDLAGDWATPANY